MNSRQVRDILIAGIVGMIFIQFISISPMHALSMHPPHMHCMCTPMCALHVHPPTHALHMHPPCVHCMCTPPQVHCTCTPHTCIVHSHPCIHCTCTPHVCIVHAPPCTHALALPRMLCMCTPYTHLASF